MTPPAPEVASEPALGQAPDTSPRVDKDGAAIQEMFGEVAGRYDFLNHFLSVGLDVWWRRRAAAALAPLEGRSVLDLCCGTGDQALALAGRGAHVTAVDFCVPMLAIAAGKYTGASSPIPAGLAGDALVLPFAGGTFEAATVSFGLRNVADLDAALAEIHRVLAPGGRVAFLEFALPRRKLIRGAYLFYFRQLLPRIGGWLSPRGSAYTYLPESVLEFPQREAFCSRMERVGFVETAWRDLSAGTVALYTGARAV